MHHLFLTEAAIYILVLDASKTDSDRVRFWLQSIRSQAKDTPIIIVGTHCDILYEEAEKNARKIGDLLHERFLSVVRGQLTHGRRLCTIGNGTLLQQELEEEKRIRVISCASPIWEGQKELRELLQLITSNLSLLHKDFPALYMLFFEVVYTDPRLDAIHSTEVKADALPIIEGKHILAFGVREADVREVGAVAAVLGALPVTEVRAIAELCGLTESNCQDALKLFHDFGFLLHFADNPKLRDRVFLRPQKLLNTLRIIITAREKLTRQLPKSDADNLFRTGALSAAAWQLLWQGYHPSVAPVLKELLLRFGLAASPPASLADALALIIPGHIDDAHPVVRDRLSRRKAFTAPIEFVYSFPAFSPLGLVSGLIVAAMEASTTQLVWSRGCIVNYRDTALRISLEQRNDGDILISVERPTSRDQLRLFIEDFLLKVIEPRLRRFAGSSLRVTASCMAEGEGASDCKEVTHAATVWECGYCVKPLRTSSTAAASPADSTLPLAKSGVTVIMSGGIFNAQGAQFGGAGSDLTKTDTKVSSSGNVVSTAGKGNVTVSAT